MSAPPYPFATLPDALAAARFDPHAPESFTVVWAADLHYGIGDPEQILPPILAEVNAIHPRPAFFGIVGDLIVSASRCFGHVPDEQERQAAVAEFRTVQRHLALLDPHIPLRLTLGNHDTYPSEPTPALFHSVFPEHPVDHAFTVQGVRFLFLNGGGSGLIDERQRTWFRDEARRGYASGSTLVLAVHQPSLGSVTAERGIPAAFREALAECDGDLWMVAGHGHRNQDTCYRLPRAVITQAAITAANPATWGTEHPGYWIYGFTGGKLATRIFRRLGQGFALAAPPPLQEAQPLRLPFEDHEEILWHVLVGEGDRPYLVEADAAWCLNYWHYTRSLTYRFPLDLARAEPGHLLIAETPAGKEPQKYALSPDGELWEEVTPLEQSGSHSRLGIPEACRKAGSVVVRVEQCVVSGFALAR